MNIHLHLKVKFRAFGVTFGTVDKAFYATVKPSGPLLTGEEKPLPSYEKKLMDKSGVLLEISVE